jgi:glycosyltransferase involved in cell wall biosynthesis
VTKRPLNIAIIGTRGVPANYGGFETFAEELSTRLVSRGHRVTVYSRSHFVPRATRHYRGVQIRVLPCIRRKYLETVTHTAVSIARAMLAPHQVLLVCNAANAFLCFLPGLAGQKVVLNVDGIERQRRKWNAVGRAYYRLGEFLATQLADCVVSDARVIQEYYQQEYGFATRFIAYGASAERLQTTETVARLGITPGRYILYVSRLEPENNAHLVIEAYARSQLELPLVLVGNAPYARKYIERLRRQAEGLQVLMPGAIYGTGYRELLSHCLCYVHATEVGGTHPALIEAMGAGATVLANDTPENREVLSQAGLIYRFNDPASLATLMREVCGSPSAFRSYRSRGQQRVARCYDWEAVVDQYEALFVQLVEE